MHYSQQRHEAIWETNALIRYFLGQRNLQAANYAFCKVSLIEFCILFFIYVILRLYEGVQHVILPMQVPEDSVRMILEKLEIDEEMLHTQPEAIPDKIYAGIREYFCYKAYLVSYLIKICIMCFSN